MPPTLYAVVKLALQNKGSRSSEETEGQVLQKTAALLNSAFQPFLPAISTRTMPRLKAC